MKKVAIVQSNYIPWKGYFDLIASVDEFIFYDDMQYTQRDWRNRNLIKTSHGVKWLSIPVNVKGKRFQTIRETEISSSDWAETHWKTLVHAYRRTPYFDEVSSWLKPLYERHQNTPYLYQINHDFLATICRYLGILTKLSVSWDYDLIGEKSERLAELSRQAGADVYISGPAAKEYLNETVFETLGLSVEWFSYSGYPPYQQPWGDFEHGVSIVDLLFCCGQDALLYFRGHQ